MVPAKKDHVFEDARPDDIVILVMGPTGVGKSTFVNHLARGAGINQTVEVGDDLESCTVNLQAVSIPALNIPSNITFRGHRLVIVDTPGFDDTYAEDSEILRRVEVWLASSYSNTNLGGVIYLHDISQPRMSDIAVERFKGLCKTYDAKSMVLGTTKWAGVPLDAAEKREKQLCDKHWDNILKEGPQTARFEGTSGSAWTMVNQILLIQNDLAELENTTPDPGAEQNLKLPQPIAFGSQKKKTRWLKKVEAAKQAVQAEEKVWLDGRPDDIVVVVMGPTGVGKSTFVKHLVEGRVDQAVSLVVGEDLESCTIHLQPIPIPKDKLPVSLEGRGSRLVMVDTPGFDDTYTDDSEILRRIAHWLASSYSKDMKLGGVIYLHDISEPRMLGSTRRNFEMFWSLCGDSAGNAMILGTTKWAGVPVDVGEKREKILHQKFWGEIMMLGARSQRFENTSDSAWSILKTLLQGGNAAAEAQILRIQEELVELEKIIPTTDAGKKLRYRLQEALEMQKNSASHPGSRDHSVKMAEELRLIENLVSQIDELEVPMWHRLKAFFFGDRRY